MPLVTIGMFIGMNRSGILNIPDVNIPYPLYAILGLTIWSVFTVGLSACTSALLIAGSMITKINFPKAALIFAASGQGIVEFIIRSTLIILAFLYFGVAPHWSSLFVSLLCLIPLYLMMVGMGFILSLVAGVLRDIINALNLILTAAMLLSPILYPIQGDSFLAQMNVWNPFNYFINVPRDLIVTGETSHYKEFFIATGLSIAVFYVGWKLFYYAQTKIAERI